MGVKKQNHFTKEYKIDAVKLAKELGSVVEAAKKLGVTPKNIYNWKERYAKDGSDAFPGKGKLTADDAKIHGLESEVRKLKQELEFLKKAASYFAAQQK